jgi:hypothetical protein
MILTSYRNARPNDWSAHRGETDPSMRRLIHGPIQSMDEDRTFLWRLFHTRWLKRLVRLDPAAPAAADAFVPACATVELISGAPLHPSDAPRQPNGSVSLSGHSLG